MKSEIESYLGDVGVDAREASISISTASLEQKSKCLKFIAQDLHKNRSSIKETNIEDCCSLQMCFNAVAIQVCRKKMQQLYAALFDAKRVAAIVRCTNRWKRFYSFPNLSRTRITDN